MRHIGQFGSRYVRQHPLTSGILLGAVLGLAVLIPLAWSHYRATTTEIRVAIASFGKSKSVESIRLHIRRGLQARDELDVRFSLAPLPPSDRLMVIMPASFQYEPGFPPAEPWQVEARQGPKGITHYYLSPKAGRNRETECWLRFRGPVFLAGPLFDIHLSVFAEHNNVTLDLPTQVTISGLDGLTLDQLIPDPETRSSSYLVYSADSWESKTFDYSLTLRGFDRRAASANQFFLFAVATLIGVLAAVLASGLQAVVREYERAWRRPLKNTPQEQ